MPRPRVVGQHAHDAGAGSPDPAPPAGGSGEQADPGQAGPASAGRGRRVRVRRAGRGRRVRVRRVGAGGSGLGGSGFGGSGQAGRAWAGRAARRRCPAASGCRTYPCSGSSSTSCLAVVRADRLARIGVVSDLTTGGCCSVTTAPSTWRTGTATTRSSAPPAPRSGRCAPPAAPGPPRRPPGVGRRRPSPGRVVRAGARRRSPRSATSRSHGSTAAGAPRARRSVLRRSDRRRQVARERAETGDRRRRQRDRGSDPDHGGDQHGAPAAPSRRDHRRHVRWRDDQRGALGGGVEPRVVRDRDLRGLGLGLDPTAGGQGRAGATACLGSASTATGRPSSAETIWATSGIRDEPPTSSTECRSSGVRPGRARGPAQRLDVSATRRADHVLELGPGEPDLVCTFGSSTGIDRRCPRQRLLGLDALPRSRATAAATAPGRPRRARASLPPRRVADVVEHRGVEVDAAEPLDALGWPRISKPVAVLRSTAASNVPPPRSYTATMAPGLDPLGCCA